LCQHGLGRIERGSGVTSTVSDGSSIFSRRHLLKWALGAAGAVVVGGAIGVELVNTGVLPGKQYLNEIDGACDVSSPPLHFATLGFSKEGLFYSHARQRDVGYTLAYPATYSVGGEAALVIMLHGFGGTHRDAFVDMTPTQAVALMVADMNAAVPVSRHASIVVATDDGGGGYWHPHPGDDPMGMVVNEFIPMLQAHGIGDPSRGIGLMGISMGGYGAMAIAERYPEKFRAVAAISPAVWTSYDQSRTANAGAFVSASDFAEYDIIAHSSALSHLAVRVASGVDDPFHPGVVALIKALPTGAQTYIGGGCHSSPFFVSQEPASLAFLSSHLT